MPKKIAIIPARYSSSRLPGKPLADICGKPMIIHVCQRAEQISGIDMVAVATDNEKIMKSVLEAGFIAVMTSVEHASGTDRVAEAAAKLGFSEQDIVINIQGDQPLLESKPVQAMIRLLESDSALQMTTVACPLDINDLNNPNRVKVIVDNRQRAIYFSRAPIPFDRDGIVQDMQRCNELRQDGFAGYLRHLGLYAFRFGFLVEFVSLAPGVLERIEMLEQLRAIENGYSIGVALVEYAPAEVDTPEDLEKIRMLAKTGTMHR